jgi:hypothetical protein
LFIGTVYNIRKDKSMTPHQAKKIIKQHLDEHQLAYTRLSARTIHFSSLLGRDELFVKVHGWEKQPAWADLVHLAKANGFCVEA